MREPDPSVADLAAQMMSWPVELVSRIVQANGENTMSEVICIPSKNVGDNPFLAAFRNAEFSTVDDCEAFRDRCTTRKKHCGCKFRNVFMVKFRKLIFWALWGSHFWTPILVQIQKMYDKR